MLNALTGIITPYFFLNIENPLIGFLKRVFVLFTATYSPNEALGTYHNNILPSVAKDKTL